MTLHRREWLLGAGALGVTTLAGCASTGGSGVPAKARVLLQLALTKTKDPVAIQKMFYEY